LVALIKTRWLPYSAAHWAHAAVLESTLFVANGNLAAAFDLVEKGQAWCANSCAALPSLLLLRAQIALRSQRPDEAIEHASNVLRRLDGTQLIEEKANALRVIGEALLEKNNPVESIPRFEQALALDREAGATQKIGIDLMYLGQASNLVNKHGDANTYFRRAAAVRTASGDKVGGEAAARNIEPKE
ncbi:MAG: tetratricopeptide repeat protein, partial [Burkholderiaceae bacterium]